MMRCSRTLGPKIAIGIGVFLGFGHAGSAIATERILFKATSRPRGIVLTDIANEPDGEESMARFLVYSNECDVEGLIDNGAPALFSYRRLVLNVQP